MLRFIIILLLGVVAHGKWNITSVLLLISFILLFFKYHIWFILLIHKRENYLIYTETCADEPEAIVGGTPAAPGEFPYQCSMNMNNQHFCGCSILSATKILTAAHCVESGKSPFQIRIRTGSIYSQSGNTHAVKSIVMHPEYQSGAWYSWNNDIAVITVSFI